MAKKNKRETLQAFAYKLTAKQAGIIKQLRASIASRRQDHTERLSRTQGTLADLAFEGHLDFLDDLLNFAEESNIPVNPSNWVERFTGIAAKCFLAHEVRERPRGRPRAKIKHLKDREALDEVEDMKQQLLADQSKTAGNQIKSDGRVSTSDMSCIKIIIARKYNNGIIPDRKKAGSSGDGDKNFEKRCKTMANAVSRARTALVKPHAPPPKIS